MNIDASSPYDLSSWVDEAPDSEKQEFREAIHVILLAVTGNNALKSTMVIKGGILMAIRYKSPRFTQDIDFSTGRKMADFNLEQFLTIFEQNLALAVESTDYDLDCRIQKTQIQPPGNQDASFPSLKMSVGYAYKGSRKHKRLLKRQSPSVVSIDYSLNEPTLNLEKLDVGNGAIIHAYALSDLVAEKFRALFQQEERDRFRRQDVFDLKVLIEQSLSSEKAKTILDSLRTKAQSRGIEVTPESMSNPEIRRRAKHEYSTLGDEVEGPLPDFEEAYDQIEAFYRSLPWDVSE